MKNVLITGGSRGIGKAIKEVFESNGYNVIAPSRQELELNDNKSIESFIEKYKDYSFDVIVNNAGINEINELTDVSDDELSMMLNINLVAPIKLLRAFIPKMKEQKYGKIVNIGSIWAVVSKPGRSIYSATKNGMHGITNALALELAPYNILVNTVCPGFTLTELTRKNNTVEQINQISNDIPMQRMAMPSEIAEVVYFLCSEKNTYLTGQKITVDGGFTEK